MENSPNQSLASCCSDGSSGMEKPFTFESCKIAELALAFDFTKKEKAATTHTRACGGYQPLKPTCWMVIVGWLRIFGY
ncbi:MAG: hypothetical protein K1Y36_14580 [Blastocatellia bacterium]|nr:hypothetical protein [Blastocatellia bacterium]